MYYLTLSGKLFIAPLTEDKLHRVLDLGTGTGIWAIDFGRTPLYTPVSEN
jgi:ribosomal protein L11 methylase PrmA